MTSAASSDDAPRSPYTTASIAQTKQILRDLWTSDAPTGLVPMLHGPAGIGKTSLVSQEAQSLKFERVVKLIASKIRPEDLTGVPYPYRAGYTRFHPPLTMWLLTKEGQAWAKKRHERRASRGLEKTDFAPLGKTVLFLDEITLAHQDIQAPLNSLIEERTLGADELELDDNVHLIAAGNRAEHGAFAHPMSIPTKTRLGPHIDVEPTLEEWVSWARGVGVHPAVVAFLQQQPVLFDTTHRKDSGRINQDRTYATRRTWAKVSQLVQSVRDPDLLAISIEGMVGTGPASSFMSYYRTARNAPTVDEIAKHPATTDTFDAEPDIAHVVVENILYAIRRNPNKYAEPLMEYAGRMHSAYVSMIAHAVTGQAERQPEEVVAAIMMSPAYDVVARTFADTRSIEVEGDAAQGRVAVAPPRTTRRASRA